MGKLLLILVVALVFEAIGVVFLNKGIKEIGEELALRFGCNAPVRR